MYSRFAVAVAIMGVSLCVWAQDKPAAPYKTKHSNEFKVNNDHPSRAVSPSPAAKPHSTSSELQHIESEHPGRTAGTHAQKQSATPIKEDKGKPGAKINFKPGKTNSGGSPRAAADPYKGRLRDKGSR